MKNVLKADALALFNAASLSTTLQEINASGFAGPVAIMRVVNDSNKPVIISYDGATLNDYIPAGGTLNLNFQANSGPNNYVSMLRKGSVIWIYGAATGSGYIYLSAYYLES